MNLRVAMFLTAALPLAACSGGDGTPQAATPLRAFSATPADPAATTDGGTGLLSSFTFDVTGTVTQAAVPVHGGTVQAVLQGTTLPCGEAIVAHDGAYHLVVRSSAGGGFTCLDGVGLEFRWRSAPAERWIRASQTVEVRYGDGSAVLLDLTLSEVLPVTESTPLP